MVWLAHVNPGVSVYHRRHRCPLEIRWSSGRPPFDYHPIYDIPSPAAVHGQVFTVRFVLLDSSGLYADSAEFSLSMTAACAGDYNLNGVVDVGDIFDFLAGWFAGDTRANFDGVGG